MQTGIFKILNFKAENQNYWQVTVFNEAKSLIVNPFGELALERPDLRLSFNIEDPDEFGWWHLSCSFAYQRELKCILHNKRLV